MLYHFCLHDAVIAQVRAYICLSCWYCVKLAELMWLVLGTEASLGLSCAVLK